SCAVEHSPSKELLAAVAGGEKTVPRVFVETDGKLNFPLQCRHCQEPACVYACMSGALSKEEKTGKVVVSEEKCVGCWMCVMTCPFGAIIQGSDHKVIKKCDRCPDREEPACTTACPTDAIQFISVDQFSKDRRRKYLTVFNSQREEAEQL
ncbi:MAG: anaerobic carbon-monoxide dehydrogenase iron sulfur subunit, partial [Clostridia bacterium]|nr:anaerobic carbon-monoxide dehydrogenase iron sulfur subunit [Clostridia bacterium]